MRIVTREELLRMPAGTVYMIPYQEERAVGLEEGIFIKGDNVGGWTWYYTLTSDWQHDDEDFADSRTWWVILMKGAARSVVICSLPRGP